VSTLWRISNHADLVGLGGEKADGRWHTAARGRRIVYLSEHPALALVEVLANLKGDPKLFPDTYRMMKVEAPDGVSSSTLPVDSLAADWREQVRDTRAMGDAWLEAGESALLWVPSAVAPESWNVLLNPLHREARLVTMVWARRVAYDKRLFQVTGHSCPVAEVRGLSRVAQPQVLRLRLAQKARQTTLRMTIP
jgi:RES domain-containing protein